MAPPLARLSNEVPQESLRGPAGSESTSGGMVKILPSDESSWIPNHTCRKPNLSPRLSHGLCHVAPQRLSRHLNRPRSSCGDVTYLLLHGVKDEKFTAAAEFGSCEGLELEMELPLEYGYELEGWRSSFSYAGSHYESRAGTPMMPTLHIPTSSPHLPFSINAAFSAHCTH